MAPPLVSVCIPNLNKRPYLERRMESILAQTNSDWEIVVCDSYSEDGSWECFQKFAGDPRVRLYQVPREGMYAGWNECVGRARGRYVHLATSDDAEYPDFQEALVSLLEEHPDCQLAYSAFQEVDENDQPYHTPTNLSQPLHPVPSGPVRRSRETELYLSLALWAPWVTVSGVICRRELFQATGPFRRDLGTQADLPWAWEALVRTDTLHDPRPLASWRRYEEQATSTGKTLVDSAWDGAVLIAAAEDFMAKSQTELPASWRARPQWREEVQAMRRQVWREYAGLNRQILKEDPPRFWRALRWAAKRDHPYLVRQLGTGFGFPREVYGTSADPMEWLARKKLELKLPEQQPLC